MALQTKNILSSTTSNGFTLVLELTENSTNITNNTSSISYVLKLKSGGNSFSTYYIGWDIYLGGKQVSYCARQDSKQRNLGAYSSITIASGSTTITHDDDGNCNMSASATIDMTKASWTPGDMSLSGSMKLTYIARKANILSAPDFNDEQNPTITYMNDAGNAVDELKACISFTGNGANIPYRDISKTDTSYTFELTEDERNILRNSIPNDKSRTVKFFIRTKIAGTYYYSSVTKTFTIVNSNPIFHSDNLDYYDSNVSVIDITEDSSKIVSNKSNLVVTYTPATAQKGASIVKYSFTLKGITKDSTENGGEVNFGVINSNTNLTLSAVAIDSRGNTSSVATKTIGCYKYVAPSFVSFNAYRADENGNANLNGAYIKWDYEIDYTEIGNNGCIVKIFGIPENSGEETVSGSSYISDISKTYSMYASVIDSFGGYNYSPVITVFGQSRVFNVYPDGSGIAFGKMAEFADLMDILFNMQCRKDLQVDGVLTCNKAIIGDYTDWSDLTLTENFQVYNSTVSNMPKYKAFGNVVTICGVVSPIEEFTSTLESVIIAAGLPEDLRPKTNQTFVCQGSGMNRWLCTVATSGNILMSRYGTTEPTTVPTTAWLTFNCTYMI